jgi:hypothetical protein
MIKSDPALDVGPGEADLVVEPDLQVQLAGDPAGVGEAVPPLLTEPGRVVRHRPESRTGRREIDHHQVVDPAVGEAA